MSERPSTTPAFNRAERLLNRLVGDKIMTQAGKDWLVAIIDPFHDTELKRLDGWPDVETGYSVVRKVRQAVNITVPSAIAGNWDALIQFTPLLNPKYYSPTGNRIGNTAEWPNTAPALLGGLEMWGMTPGSAWNPFGATTYPLAYLNVEPPYSNGVGRLLSIGFEVVNTTGVLYRQGACTVFKLMQTIRDPAHFVFTSTAATNPVYATTGTVLRQTPAGIANINLLPGSRTWKAEEGAYVVGHFHSNDNPPYVADFNTALFAANDDLEGTVSTLPLSVPQAALGVSSTGLVLAGTAAHIHPIHTSGAYFTGLSNQTTMQVTMTYYYETFPGITEREILVMATPSAGLDSVALEVYSHCLSTMPPGVMFCENPFGEWFADVVEQVSNALSYIPHPIAQALSTVGKTGVGMYRGTVATSVPSQQGTYQRSLQAGPTRTKRAKKVKANNELLRAGNRTTNNGKRVQGPLTQVAQLRRRQAAQDREINAAYDKRARRMK